MLVSLSARLHGRPPDDDYAIDALIRQHQSDLALTYLINRPVKPRANTESIDYWIGEYHPNQFHSVELISHDNRERFEQNLQQHQLYPTESPAMMTPNAIILANGLDINSDIQARLQALSVPVLQSPFPVKTVLRNLAYSAAEREHSMLQHGVILTICGQGVLITGESGTGKSGIALELISRGHRLVADDAPLLHRPAQSRRIYAVSSPLLADLLDVRAAGILDICRLFGKRATQALTSLDLVIELTRDYQPTPEAQLSPFNTRTNILGLALPYLQIPISHATNLALLVETIARNHVIYQHGYDASSRLIEQQRQLIEKQPQ